MFLEPDAVRRLTGYAHKTKQVAKLREQGIAFHINARGEPIVACSVVEGGKPPLKQRATWQPAALKRA